jgi:hypothetical protein
LRWVAVATLAAAGGALATAEPGHSMAIHAVAPGRAVAGSLVRLYGRELAPGRAVMVRLDDASGTTILEQSISVSPQHSLAVGLPAALKPGPYTLLAVPPEGDAAGWPSPLEVVPDEVTVPPPEPGLPATARLVVPGQAVIGAWAAAGDTHFYLLRSGRGVAFRITLERVEHALSPFHPQSVDPELWVADPSGFVDRRHAYARDRSADDTDAELRRWVSIADGGHLIGCRSSRATGAYRLRVERLDGSPPTRFEVLRPRVPVLNVIGPVAEQRFDFSWLLLDPWGVPAANALLTLKVDGGGVTHGSNQPTSADGVATVTLSALLDESLALAASFPWPEAEAAPGDGLVAPRSGPLLHVDFDPFTLQVDELRSLR